jgi:hypothetical protein
MEWTRKHHPHAGWILTAPADAPFLPMDLTVRLCGLMHVPEPDVLMVRHGRRREHTLAMLVRVPVGKDVAIVVVAVVAPAPRVERYVRVARVHYAVCANGVLTRASHHLSL